MKSHRIFTKVALAIFVLTIMSSFASADVRSAAISKTTAYVLRMFGREGAELGAETVAKNVGRLAAKHGDVALQAFQRVGPKVAKLTDEVADPGLAIRLLASRGDDAVRIVAKPRQLALASRLGDDGVDCLLKHGEAVEGVLESCGAPAATALKNLSSQNARRVSMMAADGELTKLGKADEILGVISRFSDAGAAWIWNNKGSLTVATTLTAFLLSPGEFIEGGKDLAGIAADAAVKPVVASAAQSFPWMMSLLLVGVVCCVAIWIWRVPHFAKVMLLRGLVKVIGQIRFSK